MFDLSYIVFILLGFVVGVLMGVTGMGGAVLMTPALILLGVSPLTAVGTDLLFMAVTKSFGTLFHGIKRNLDIKIGIKLFLGALPAFVIAYVILLFIDKDFVNRYLTFVLGGLLVLVAILTFIRLKAQQKEDFKKTASEENGMKQTLTILAVGFIVGLTVQFTSVGAGIIVIFALVYLLKMTPKVVVGTSLLFGVMMSILGAVSHFTLGNVDYIMAIFLMIGSVVGIYFGTQMTTKIPAAKFKVVLDVGILFLGLFTLGMAVYKM